MRISRKKHLEVIDVKPKPQADILEEILGADELMDAATSIPTEAENDEQHVEVPAVEAETVSRN